VPNGKVVKNNDIAVMDLVAERAERAAVAAVLGK
jgi:hypothetical protein